MKKHFLFLSVALATLMSLSPIHAQQSGPGMAPDQGFMTDRLLEEDIDRGAGGDRDIDRDEDPEELRDEIRKDIPDLEDGPA